MKPARIAELRQQVASGRLEGLKAGEMLELLDAVEKRPVPPEVNGQTFTRWLMELETISGRAYSAKDIAWFRQNCFAKGMSPAKALDVREREFGI